MVLQVAQGAARPSVWVRAERGFLGRVGEPPEFRPVTPGEVVLVSALLALELDASNKARPLAADEVAELEQAVALLAGEGDPEPAPVDQPVTEKRARSRKE